MRRCNFCGEDKPISKFYLYQGKPHGRKCKSCTRKASLEYRVANIERVREHDRSRGNRQPAGYTPGWRRKFPAKYRALTTVGNAVRDGRLDRRPCEVCGSTSVHAHHDDYLRPLDVRWLCPAHHRQWHRDNGPGLNGEAA